MDVDLLIRGGTVLDGTGGERAADVAVKDGRILSIGNSEAMQARETLDAAGLYVTPGFIDIHSHSDYTLLVDPRAVSAITQGVTLEVIGNCGFGCAPILNPEIASGNIYGFNNLVKLDWNGVGQYLDRLAEARPAVNVVKLVPNGQLRRSVVGVTDLLDPAADLAGLHVVAEFGHLDRDAGHPCLRCCRRRLPGPGAGRCKRFQPVS